MDNQARGQAVGNAAKVAVDLTAIVFGGTPVGDPTALFQVWQQLHQQVATSMIALNESLETPAPAAPHPAGFSAEQAVVSAFPGTTVVTAPVAQPAVVAAAPVVVAPPSAVLAQVPAPAAIPNAGNPAAGNPEVAEAWEVFFADVQNRTFEANWHDNRTSKRSANSPDFRHKTWKRKPSDRYTVGLYLVSDKNPADLPQRLAAVGIQV